MSLPRYPAYKDSGVKWLGEVPDCWSVDRLKASIISCKNGVWGQDALQDENDIPCVRVADFDRQKLSVSLQDPTIRNVLEKDRNERVLTKNNLLLEKSGEGENQLVGCVVLYEDENPAVCSNFVAKITIAPNMNPSYWRYVHFAIYSVRLNYCSIKQTSGIQNLDQDSYFNEKASFPSFQEQTLIAQFLDSETAKIDDLIAEQENLITLLDEKRQAMISHAVTKGLNPDAPMKNSGVAWLGKVPEHWEITPLKYLAKIGNGSTPHRDNLDYWDNGHYPWLNSSVVNQDEISESDQFVTALALKECHLPIIKPPAILVGITGQGRTRGMAATLVFEATINQHVVYVKPIEDIVNISFLRRFFDKSYSDLRTESDSTGSTKGAITCEQIENLLIPLPKLLEQIAIANYIDQKTIQLDTLKSEAQRGIELLKERRIALISAAVTGKIDVRGLTNTEAA